VAIEVPGGTRSEGSSGVPLPHLEVTVRDEAGNRSGPDEVGEICIGPRATAEIGPCLRDDWSVDPGRDDLPGYRPMLGYWKQDEASRLALSAGYLRTGDVGSIDKGGVLTVSDRISLMLNRGGANVYPAEIERVVTGIDGVDGCGVFGVPDERLGERVAILVQFEPAAERDLAPIVERLRAELAGYKVPELGAAVDQLARNAMGKIDRKRLVETGTAIVERLPRQRTA